MLWLEERCLIYMVSEKWCGWFCARCCWNHKTPLLLADRDLIGAQIRQDFESHDCEVFAREHWQ